MNLRAEGEPIGLLDRANPAFIQYNQDWQDLQRSPYVALLTSDISAIPQKKEAILSEVTDLQQQLQELRDQRKGSGRALVESHQRQGSRHFWSFLPWVNNGPNKKAIRTQVRDYDSQIEALRERVKKVGDGQQGKIDHLSTQGSLWEANRLTQEKQWAVSDGSYRVVRFAFEAVGDRTSRKRLFETYLDQQRQPTPDLNLGSLQQTYQEMVDEDLINKGFKKPPIKIEAVEPDIETEVKSKPADKKPEKNHFSFHLTFVEFFGLGKGVEIRTQAELANVLSKYSGLVNLRTTSVVEKLEQLAALNDKQLSEKYQRSDGHYLVPFGKRMRWFIYFDKKGNDVTFNIHN